MKHDKYIKITWKNFSLKKQVSKSLTFVSSVVHKVFKCFLIRTCLTERSFRKRTKQPSQLHKRVVVLLVKIAFLCRWSRSSRYSKASRYAASRCANLAGFELGPKKFEIRGFYTHFCGFLLKIIITWKFRGFYKDFAQFLGVLSTSWCKIFKIQVFLQEPKTV